MTDVLDLKNPDTLPDSLEPELLPELTTSGGSPSVSWTADMTPTAREKFRERLLMAGLLIAGLAVAYWQASWLTAAVLVLGALAWELHHLFPRTHRVHVNEAGVTIDEHTHRHEHLASYDIHPMPDGSVHLSLMTRRWHLPHVHLSLGDQDPAQVDAVLSHYVVREEHRIPLIDYFIKK